MKRLALALLLTAPTALFAADPRFPFPKTPDEIWQNDKDLGKDIRLRTRRDEPRTLAQIQATVPLTVGERYYCTDCATHAICVSTSVLVGRFASPASKTTACN